ncbi:tautomerase family protein [Opitutus sp. ER46]|uniref:tautomerase family protein n=1 Tax=Opitutus sp. ER46 TaxID=2161864 RepID=UPI000D319BE9|nr:tautomerase family protein [Opitutus sp. ER46]PTX98920.1 tautomerase family protein [Opitutus sp. ER46]
MPFVEIYLRSGKPAAYRRALGDSVHAALVAALGVPPDDHFQVITEVPPDGFICDPQYLGIKRSAETVFIRITLGTGRTLAQKRALFAQIAAQLGSAPGLRPEDVFVALVETAAENWSFGNGVAQYADAPPAWAKR